MASTDDKDTASINGIPNRLANNYFDFQDGRIEQLKAELNAMRKDHDHYKTVAQNLHEILVEVEQERDKARRSAAAWKASAKMHREDELAFEQAIRGYEQDLGKIRRERDEARDIARRLNKRLKAIEAAVPKMAIYADFQDPIDALQQMEYYIKNDVPRKGGFS